MPTEIERLVVAMEARVAQYEKDMARAQRTTDREMRAVERRVAKANQEISRQLETVADKAGASFVALGGKMKAGIGAALAAAGVEATIAGIRNVVREVATISREAERAGISAKAFQELGYVAEQNGIQIDALIDGIKELNLRADEFIQTGAGPAAEAFKRLGFTADGLRGKLKDPGDLLLDIFARMERLNQAGQIRVSDEIFGGTGGEQYVQLLDEGAASIRATIAEAHDLGRVLDDELLSKAEDLDRKFNAIATAVGSGLKRAVVEVVDAMAEFFDGFREIQNQADATIKGRLETLVAQRDRMSEFARRLEAEEAASSYSPFGGGDYGTQISDAKAQVADLTSEIEGLQSVLNERAEADNAVKQTGKDAADAKPKVDTLSTAISGVNGAGAAGANGLSTFADAIRALKEEIPGLADQLTDLDARARIEGAYQAAVNKARTMGDAITAGKLRDEALSALGSKGAREAGSKGFLDLIGYAEGTDKGRGYNETLGYGAFTGGNKNLVVMTLDEIDALQTQMLRNPKNGFNSSALGRYQIVQKTLRGLRGELGLSGSEAFSPELQDRLAMQLMRRRGNSVSGLRNEWEGLRRIDDDVISNAFDTGSLSLPAVDEQVQERREEAIAKNRELGQSYQDIIAGATDTITAQNLEAQALGMTTMQAAALRYEQDLLNQAASAGLTLTPQQTDQIRQLAAAMAEGEVAAEQMATSQQEAQAAAAEWESFSQGALKGLVSDLMAGKDAGEAFAGVLSKIADKLLDMAIDNLFANAFAGAGGGGGKAGGGIGGLLSNLIGSIFGGGRATGGAVSSRKAYLVGEKGPEIFAPGRSGTVIPNHHLGSLQPPPLAVRATTPAPEIKLQVVNNTGVEAGVTMEQGGDGSLRVMLDKIQADNLSRRGTMSNAALRRGYGAQQTLKSRG